MSVQAINLGGRGPFTNNYIPVIANTVNLTATLVIGSFNFVLFGSSVHLWGTVQLNRTAVSTITSFTLTLPTTKNNFATDNQAAGFAVSGGAGQSAVPMQGFATVGAQTAGFNGVPLAGEVTAQLVNFRIMLDYLLV